MCDGVDKHTQAGALQLFIQEQNKREGVVLGKVLLVKSGSHLSAELAELPVLVCGPRFSWWTVLRTVRAEIDLSCCCF